MKRGIGGSKNIQNVPAHGNKTPLSNNRIPSTVLIQSDIWYGTLFNGVTSHMPECISSDANPFRRIDKMKDAGNVPFDPDES